MSVLLGVAAQFIAPVTQGVGSHRRNELRRYAFVIMPCPGKDVRR